MILLFARNGDSLALTSGEKPGFATFSEDTILKTDEDRQIQDKILDSINEGVFTIDSDWRITAFNRAAERITGVPREKALQRDLPDPDLRKKLCPETDHADRSAGNQCHDPHC